MEASGKWNGGFRKAFAREMEHWRKQKGKDSGKREKNIVVARAGALVVASTQTSTSTTLATSVWLVNRDGLEEKKKKEKNKGNKFAGFDLLGKSMECEAERLLLMRMINVEKVSR